MSSLSTLPKGDSAWLLRKSIQRIMQQVSVLETNIGSSTTGNSANTQVIFNDNGTLRGDAGLTFNKTTDLLTVGAATITGDLTVDTNVLKVDTTLNRVGIGTASPTATLHVSSAGSVHINQRTGGNGCFTQYVDPVSSNYVGTDSGNFRVANNSAQDLLNIQQLGVFSFGDGAGGTRMTLNSTGLGVGASPANDKLLSLGSMGILLSGATSDFSFRNSGGTAIQRLRYTDATGALTIGSATGTAYPVELGGNTTTRAVTIDASSNVGIGVVPSAWGSGFRYVQAGPGCAYGTNGSVDRTDVAANWYYNGGDKYINATGKASIFQQSGGAFFWLSTNTASGGAGSAMTLNTNMTLDASGNLLVGTTSNAPAGTQSQFVNQWSGGIKWGSTFNQTVSSATPYTHIAFCTNGTVRGSIDANNAAITYGTVSDYRLKEAVQPLVGGLARISALKPSTYKWKESQSDGEGFIAHELASVVPLAVIGEKDALNEDGTIKPQQVDLSKVVPVLVAAIQELAAEVNALKNA